MTTFYQNQAPAYLDSSNTTVSSTFSSACTNGSLLVAVAIKEAITGTISVADPTNGSWTQHVIGQSATTSGVGTGSVAIFSKRNTATTALTVTATFNAASAAGGIKLYEINDSGGALSYDAGAGGGAESTAPSLAFTTTGASGVGVLGLVYYSNGTPATADAGYTEAFAPRATGNGYHWGEYALDAGAAGSKTLTANSVGTKSGWAGAAAVFSPAGGDVSTALSGSASTPGTGTQSPVFSIGL